MVEIQEAFGVYYSPCEKCGDGCKPFASANLNMLFKEIAPTTAGSSGRETAPAHQAGPCLQGGAETHARTSLLITDFGEPCVEFVHNIRRRGKALLGSLIELNIRSTPESRMSHHQKNRALTW